MTGVLSLEVVKVARALVVSSVLYSLMGAGEPEPAIGFRACAPSS